MIKCLHYNEIQRSEWCEEIFSAAARDGFHSVQIGIPAERAVTEWLTELLEQNLLESAAQHSLTITSLTLDRYDLFSLAAPDENTRRRCRETLQELIQQAPRFGSEMRVILYAHEIHPAGKPLDASYEKAFNLLFEELEDLAAVAAGAGVYLLIENPAAGLLLSPLELREFLNQINNPYVQLCFNPFHAQPLAPVNDWIDILNHRILALSWPRIQDDNPAHTLRLEDAISRLEEYRFNGPVIFK